MNGNFLTLADYLDEVRDLLHDKNDQYWTKAQKVAYINEGKRHRDLETGQNRVQFSYTLTVNRDTYSLYDLATQNPEPPSGPTDITQGLSTQTILLSPTQTVGYRVIIAASWETEATTSNLQAGHFDANFSTPAPANAKAFWQIHDGTVRPNAVRAFDLIAINLLYNNLRIVMGQYSLTEMNASTRVYLPPLSWAPMQFARYSPTGVVFAPAPSIAYVTEWDCSTVGAPLVYDTDCDLLPFPYTDPVPFFAAYKAKINERQGDEAAVFYKEYERHMMSATNSRAGMVPNMYSSNVTRL